METIIDHLTQPIIKPTKNIIYAYSDAFTTCDCGKELMLTQRIFGDNTYRGMCCCGKNWTLLNGKIKSW